MQEVSFMVRSRKQFAAARSKLATGCCLTSIRWLTNRRALACRWCVRYFWSSRKFSRHPQVACESLIPNSCSVRACWSLHNRSGNDG